MQILQNHFQIEMDQWEDPGDYPSGAGGCRLPSYDYVGEVSGRLVVEFENDMPSGDELSKIADEFADIPTGIKVNKWNCEVKGNTVTFEIEEFDDSEYKTDSCEPDYEDYDE